MAHKPSMGLADIIAASTSLSGIDGCTGLFSVSRTARVTEQHCAYVGERGLTWTPRDRR
jgi:hypothetical protein